MTRLERQRDAHVAPGTSTGAAAAAGVATSPAPDALAGALLAWFDRHGRHDLPWQHPRTPYRVWLSEVMLQQTRVGVVVPYFERFVAALPSVEALAVAPQDQVLALWSGLGYYARARNLQAAARRCVDRHGGDLPRDLDALMALPGIGRSTAGAILAQAWGDRQPILDGNVKRVLARVHGVEGWPGQPAVEKRLWSFAQEHLPQARLADYTQALMDLGATVCTRHTPACRVCPLATRCVALARGRTADLPTPRPGKSLPQREALVLMLFDEQGRVLLQRRPPAGVWASLWSLPEAANGDGADAWLRRHLGQVPSGGLRLDPIVHVFSHFRLHMHPRLWRAVAPPSAVGDNDDLRWVPREGLGALGIPAPIRALVEARFDREQEDQP